MNAHFIGRTTLLILWYIFPMLVIGAGREISSNPQPQWWKGNLHTHTFWSDGNDFPEMVAEWYLDHGYNFLALSDHNILSQGQKWVSLEKADQSSNGDAYPKYLKRFGHHWVETRGSREEGNFEIRLKPLSEYRALVEQRNHFIMIQGEEITDGADNGLSIHMNATHLGELIPQPGGKTVKEVIANSLRLVREQSHRLGRPILFHVNHVNYKWGVTAEDLAGIIDNRFFEVWNGVDGDHDPGDDEHPSSEEIWDIANTLRMVTFSAPPLYGLATDDSHDYHGHKERAKPGRGWVMVRARHLTPESLIKAFHRGDFYSSTGVVLKNIDFNGERLAIEIESVEGETYTTRFVGSRRGVNVEGVSRRDDEGYIILTTLDYTSSEGTQIGEVFSEVTGNLATYRMEGDELYVRAIITSDAQPAVPSKEFPYKRAWTQPVGRTRWIESDSGN